MAIQIAFSAPSSGKQRHAQHRKMIAFNSLKQLHPARLQTEHPDTAGHRRPFGFEIALDKGVGQINHMQQSHGVKLPHGLTAAAPGLPRCGAA